jgi:hypothetical protein
MNTIEAGRYALIVATGKYADPKLSALRSPDRDADRLAKALRDPKIGAFEVDVSRNEEADPLRRRLARFFSNRRRDDVLFVHFSCHGIKDESGELYLAAADTEKDVLAATGIEARWLNARIARTRSARVVVLLDCCYSGSFPSGMSSRADEGVDVKEQLGGRGRAVITASTSTEYAYEGNELKGEGQPSVFTGAVVDALETGKADRDQDQRIEVTELYHYVHDRVTEATGNQKPRMSNELEGPFYIARSTYEAPVEPEKLPDELIALIDSPISGARLGAVETLSKMLRSSNRPRAAAARQVLEGMVEDDSKEVSKRAQAALNSRPETPVIMTPDAPGALQRAGEWLRGRGRLVAGVAALAVLGVVMAMVVLGGGSGGGVKLDPSFEPFPARAFTVLVPEGLRPIHTEVELSSGAIQTELQSPDNLLDVQIIQDPNESPADRLDNRARPNAEKQPGYNFRSAGPQTLGNRITQLFEYDEDEPGLGPASVATYFFNAGDSGWRTRAAVAKSVDSSAATAKEIAARMATTLKPH